MFNSLTWSVSIISASPGVAKGFRGSSHSRTRPGSQKDYNLVCIRLYSLQIVLKNGREWRNSSKLLGEGREAGHAVGAPQRDVTITAAITISESTHRLIPRSL